jgi:hypothetical protein
MTLSAKRTAEPNIVSTERAPVFWADTLSCVGILMAMLIAFGTVERGWATA